MKKMDRFLFLLMVFITTAQLSFAQVQTIRGIVNDASGASLPGVNIHIKGTTIGTATDLNGNYKIQASQGDVLVFSFVGYVTKEVKVSGSILNVTLEESVSKLNEVVITSLGISRKKRSLGYAVQTIKAKELTIANNPDVISSLEGKVAGVQIYTASGQVGASTVIKIRGNKTFYGNSSPLFVVDGTPIINQIGGFLGGHNNGTDFGNTAADIDPNDIASITVLKGATASALYGDRGLNGVVIITTKHGIKEKGIGLSYTGSIDFDNVYLLPNYQNSYGQGARGSEYYWKRNHPEMTYPEYAATKFSWKPNNDWDESWGPRLDQGYDLVQFDSPVDANGNRIPTPWVSHPNNIKDFYVTGINFTNSVAIDAGNENASGRFTISQTNQKGTSPNTDQKRLNLGINSTIKIAKIFKVDVNVNFVNTKNDNIPYQGNSMRNPLFEFNGWFGRQVDMRYLKDHYNDWVIGGNGKLTPLNWMMGYSTQHNNPYWNAYMNKTSRERNNVYGNVNFTLNLSKGIDLIARAGTDIISEHRKMLFYQGTKGYAFVSQTPQNGAFYEQNRFESETNVDLLLNFNKQLSEVFSLSGVAGANYRYSKSRYASVSAQDLVIPNFFSTSNIKDQPIVNNTLYEYKSNSLYASANLGFKDYLYLGLSYRQDWSSSLAKNNWSFGYPSVSLGYIFSKAFGIDKGAFTYGKIRASYSEVGNATSPYQLLPVYYSIGSSFSGAAGSVDIFSLSSTIPSNNLKPQRSKSWEFGGDFKFLQNRLGLDVSYYNALTENQIMSVPVSSASGYNYRFMNAGAIRNKGVEIQLYATPVRSKNFSWDLNLNWSKNKNTVVSLAKGIDDLIINTFNIRHGVTLRAVPGAEWGMIYGSSWQTDASGNVLIGQNGLPLTASEPKVIGNVNPDFIGSLGNTFNYKSFSLSVLVNFRKGGDIYSFTKAIGQNSGILQSTVKDDQRVNGMVAKGVYGPGVVGSDGNDISGQPNTTVVSSFIYWSMSRSWAELSIVDGSFIKLREITLSYALPKKYASKLRMQNITFSFYGRNLALLYTAKSNDAHIDPEVATGGSASGTGLEQYQLPPARVLGFKLHVNF